jgi:integrase/recombinase XerC
MPDDIRQFLASQSKCYRTPSSVKMLISALRSYFRFRNACGDQVNHLISVTSYPANWQLASLPKALNKDEVARLLRVIGDPNQSSRRDLAIVHCTLNLGLRSAEVAKLGLDDIDWQTGTRSHCEEPRVGAKTLCPCRKPLVVRLPTI